MVLPAASARSLTTVAIDNTNTSELRTEVSRAEVKIRQATAAGAYIISYNANIVGNPVIDPRLHTDDLPVLQQDFYNAFVDSGYIVGIDDLTGYWSISWADHGPESQVIVYSIHCTFDPASVVDQTILVMANYFEALVPVVYTDIAYNGLSSSGVWQYTVVAGQDSDRTSHADTLKGFLTTQGLGYNSGNTTVTLLTP